MIETGQDPRRFAEDLLRRLRDLVIVAAVPDAPATGLIDVPQDQAERLTAQAARFGRAELTRAADLVADGLTEMQGRDRAAAAARADLCPGAAARRRRRHRGRAARLDRLEKRMSHRRACRARPPPHPLPPAAARAVAPVETSPEPVARARPADAGPAAGRPVEQRSRAAAAPAEPEPARAVEPSRPAPSRRRSPRRAAGTSSGLTLVDVRRLWPDLLEAVKHKRRFTWILLSQNAQVVGGRRQDADGRRWSTPVPATRSPAAAARRSCGRRRST